jgi:hypothetical protein
MTNFFDKFDRRIAKPLALLLMPAEGVIIGSKFYGPSGVERPSIGNRDADRSTSKKRRDLTRRYDPQP